MKWLIEGSAHKINENTTTIKLTQNASRGSFAAYAGRCHPSQTWHNLHWTLHDTIEDNMLGISKTELRQYRHHKFIAINRFSAYNFTTSIQSRTLSTRTRTSRPRQENADVLVYDSRRYDPPTTKVIAKGSAKHEYWSTPTRTLYRVVYQPPDENNRG